MAVHEHTLKAEIYISEENPPPIDLGKKAEIMNYLIKQRQKHRENELEVPEHVRERRLQFATEVQKIRKISNEQITKVLDLLEDGIRKMKDGLKKAEKSKETYPCSFSRFLCEVDDFKERMADLSTVINKMHSREMVYYDV